MTLHPEDVRYWSGWLVAWVVIFVAARLFLVNPILKALAALLRK
jgi:hypothetical protein